MMLSKSADEDGISRVRIDLNDRAQLVWPRAYRDPGQHDARHHGLASREVAELKQLPENLP